MRGRSIPTRGRPARGGNPWRRLAGRHILPLSPSRLPGDPAMYLRLSLAALCLSVLLAADWPRFRGPNGTGIVADKDVPVEWGKDNFLFKTELPGKGHSSPVVVKGKVFLLSATDKERYVVCIDANKGKELWTRKVPGKF